MNRIEIKTPLYIPPTPIVDLARRLLRSSNDEKPRIVARRLLEYVEETEQFTSYVLDGNCAVAIENYQHFVESCKGALELAEDLAEYSPLEDVRSIAFFLRECAAHFRRNFEIINEAIAETGS